MIRVHIDSTAFDREITEAGRRFERLASQALSQVAASAAASAKRTDLYKNITGKLRANTTWKPRTFFHAQLQANTRYASYVHDGTKPHVITTRDGGMLHFQVNGSWVRKSSVNHPGTSARPFLQIAADAHEAILASRLEQIATSVLG